MVSEAATVFNGELIELLETIRRDKEQTIVHDDLDSVTRAEWDGDAKENAKALVQDFLEVGDLLIARMPDPLGRSCIFPLYGPEKYVTVVDVCIVRVSEAFIASKFLMYLINSPRVREQIEGYKSGSTRKRISRGNLAKVVLTIPPLNEQTRIVAKIEALFSKLDNGIENLKTAREQLKVYRHAVLKHAFEGRLTATWREENKDKLETAEQLLERIQQEREARYQRQLEAWKNAIKDWEEDEKSSRKPVKPNEPQILSKLNIKDLEGLPEIPKDWVWTKVIQIADKVTDGEHITPKRTPTGFYLLSARNIQNGFLDLSNVDYVPFEEYERIKSRCNAEEGEILISCSGSVGRICRVPSDIEFVMVRSVALIKIQTFKTVSKFYEYLFQSPILRFPH